MSPKRGDRPRDREIVIVESVPHANRSFTEGRDMIASTSLFFKSTRCGVLEVASNAFEPDETPRRMCGDGVMQWIKLCKLDKRLIRI